MSLVDTGFSSWVDDVPQLLCELRKALMEELAAINTYDRLALGVQRLGRNPQYDANGKQIEDPEGTLSMADALALVKLIGRIRDDETEHSGLILEIIKRLDGNTGKLMAKGLT